MGTMREKIKRCRVNARVALDAYMATPGQDNDATAALGDLIADLLHLADQLDPGDGFGLPAHLQTGYAAVETYRYEADPENADEEV